jgi:integrase/recombinase XerD
MVLSQETGMPTLQEAVESFLASLRARQAPSNTVKAYAHDLTHFLRAMPPALEAITPTVIQAFLDGDGHHSLATRRRRYATLCALYQWLLRQELVATNPMERLAPVERPTYQPRPLSDETVKKILRAIPSSALRDRTLFTLVYETGMRIGEALGLQYYDVDLTQDDEKVRVLGKGRRERTILLAAAPESIRLLRRHLRQSHITAGSLFRGDPRYGGSPLPLEYSVAHHAWQQYCQTAGVEATIHQLRHSRASQLLQAGVPVTTVRKLLGHRNLQSTLLYAEVDQATMKRDLLEYQRQKRR